MRVQYALILPVAQCLRTTCFLSSSGRYGCISSSIAVRPISPSLLNSQQWRQNQSSFSQEQDPVVRAEESFSLLARRSKSWKRLKPLVSLAIDDSGALGSNSVADVGTDHGLLAVSLAVTGCFDKVLGIDVSQKALENGALRLTEEVNRRLSSSLNLDFKVGDGLRVAQPGDADLVCIAGMGVNTIIKILLATTDTKQGLCNSLLIDQLGTRRIILQPTNSRPKHLMLLYNELYDAGWCIHKERIELVSSRWYLSSLFAPVEDSNVATGRALPGEKLVGQGTRDLKERAVFREYCRHHCQWIRQDIASSGKEDSNEVLWLESFESFAMSDEC